MRQVRPSDLNRRRRVVLHSDIRSEEWVGLVTWLGRSTFTLELDPTTNSDEADGVQLCLDEFLIEKGK